MPSPRRSDSSHSAAPAARSYRPSPVRLTTPISLRCQRLTSDSDTNVSNAGLARLGALLSLVRCVVAQEDAALAGSDLA